MWSYSNHVDESKSGNNFWHAFKSLSINKLEVDFKQIVQQSSLDWKSLKDDCRGTLFLEGEKDAKKEYGFVNL